MVTLAVGTYKIKTKNMSPNVVMLYGSDHIQENQRVTCEPFTTPSPRDSSPRLQPTATLYTMGGSENSLRDPNEAHKTFNKPLQSL